jgi:hypothetical protein
VELGVKPRALCLLGRCSTTGVIPPALFCFSYFSGRLLCFYLGWPWTVILLPVASHVAGMTGTCHHTRLVGWDEVSFLLKVVSNFYPPNLSSWEVGLQVWATMPSLVFGLWKRVLLATSGWPGTHYVVQDGFELVTFLPQTPECWDYSCLPPNPTEYCIL